MSFERKRFVACLSLLAAVVVVAGCGTGADTSDRPATLPAGGTVTYKGEAVEGASVTFAPEQGGKASVGKTDGSGHFELMTFEAGDGAVPGKYTVTVVKRSEAPAEVSENSEGESAPPPKDLLPAKYAAPTSSGLNAEVAEGSENQFTFELTD